MLISPPIELEIKAAVETLGNNDYMNNDKWKMNDILVILPGITGSVLEKKNVGEIWAPAPQMISNYFFSGGSSIESLRLKYDDPDYDDGIQATRLVPYTIIPGLECFDGYTGLKKCLFEKFELKLPNASKEDSSATNYVEFAYDWRKSNRISAKRLKDLIDREIHKWRKYNDSPDAKVIFIGHSMGGLVARYYIEVLKGFKYTRALITFGTPHRGSVRAIDFLTNGYRKLGFQFNDFTEAMRSFPSVYELLPRYEAVLDIDGKWKRVFETEQNINHIDRNRAKQAYEFYTEIEAHYNKNKTLDEYKVDILPIFGWGHETAQCAVVTTDNRIELEMERPPSVEARFANGDGTVPRVSAIPVELDKQPHLWRPINQKHATMQNNKNFLADLAQILAGYQGESHEPARGLGSIEVEKGIGLEVDDLYLPEEPVSIHVTTNMDNPGNIFAQIGPVSGGDVQDVKLDAEGNHWVGKVSGLASGTYRVTVRLQNEAVGPVDPVVDIFEVV